MFPSFTGSTRPRRQVNLSGRNSNPFAVASGSRSSSTPQTAQNALAQAQQERILRQKERERPPAAIKIQKLWRGHRDREETRRRYRQEWDYLENWDMRKNLGGQVQRQSQYESEQECLRSLKLLVQFASPRNQDDVQRLYYFASRYLQSVMMQKHFLAEIWTYPLLRLAKITLVTLSTEPPVPPYMVHRFLNLLRILAVTVPKQLAKHSQQYFHVMVKVATSHGFGNPEVVSTTAVSLLKPAIPSSMAVYEGFVSEFLTTPDIPALFGSLDVFTEAVDYEYLTAAIYNLLSSFTPTNLLESRSRDSLLWLLAYFIYFRRQTFSDNLPSRDVPDTLYIQIISRLVSFLADEIGNRIDSPTFGSSVKGASSVSTSEAVKPLPAFVRAEISTLIQQENVTSLLANIDISAPADAASGSSDEASALASYALTLLRAFPRRGDEVRMWLYRGSTSRQNQIAPSRNPIPAIKYFYQAASRTKIFNSISRDPRAAVYLLRAGSSHASPEIPKEVSDQQWRVILLFLELYTFVLKVMDDEEFLSGTLESQKEWSWTKQSALPLDQVKDLTIFLKNFAFSMYWNASEIAGIETIEAKTSLAEYFGHSRPTQQEKPQEEGLTRTSEMSIAGVSGMTLAYIKGMVTGVLRMVYERE